ncbi:MAG: fructosamine kinase family protein [Sarcina sp.]
MNLTSKLFKELTDIELDTIIFTYFKKTIKYNAKLLSGGLFNTTYLISPLNESKIILRVGAINQNLLLPYEKFLMQSESLFTEECIKNNITCPKLFKTDTSRDLIDRDYMISEYIPSVPLSEIVTSKDIEDKIYYDVGLYTKKLHEIKGSKFGRIYDVKCGNGYDLWSEFLYSEIQEATQKGLKFNIFNKDEIELFKSVIIKHKNILDEIVTKYLLHGDLWTGNILVKKDEKSTYSLAAIIDGDRSFYGDKEFDRSNNWITNPAFHEGYGLDIPQDSNSILRQKIYNLVFEVTDIYILWVEYDKLEDAIKCKETLIEKAKDILNQIF